MRSREAFIQGAISVRRSPAILASVFAITLLTAVPFAMVMRTTLASHLGASLAAEQVARGVNYQWWTEFSAQAGPLAQTFETTIIGFAAVLDNLSTLLDAGGRPGPIVWLGASYLLLWLFLAGGIIDRYARGRPTRTHEFFAACGVYFVRFLRLAPFIAAAYYWLFAYVHPLLFSSLYDEITRDVTAERTAFLWRVLLYLLFGLLLVTFNIVFDYAKVRAVVEDRRSMLGAIGAAVRFVRRNAAAVATVYLLNGSMFVALLIVYAMIAPGAESSGPRMWLGFLVSQLYLLGRVWVRLVFFASEVALFQGRLAHAGYIATPPMPRPQPAIAEPFTNP
jgi:hypothetical protein